MTTRLIRLPEVVLKTGYSRSSVYNKIKDGSFPSPIRLGERCIAFVEEEIDEWINLKIAESRDSMEFAS